jgi:hypothetical protein
MQIERPVSLNTPEGGLAEMSQSPEEKKILQAIVLTRLVRLNAKLYGAVAGLFTALAIFVATNWLVLKGGKIVGPHLALLGQFFIGYRVTFGGSLIGAAYGFVFGFVVGAFVAKLYNWLVDRRAGTPASCMTAACSHEDLDVRTPTSSGR